ncbi:MAG: hypothetical protein QFB87_02870 [Patescibacteria group bacterium]|nr:hypothetical protein [Patescibacteria group bacterium]
MKRLLSVLSILASTASLLLAPGISFADTPFWQADISTPATQNSRTFGVAYTVLSTQADSFTAQLYQDGNDSALQTQDTSTDPNAVNGNSGTFTVTVPGDGDYGYHVVLHRDADPSDTKTTASKTVHVDATAPDAPFYAGKTRSGNTYNLTFTAPNSPDVTLVQIFASTSTSYAASSNTRVGSISVTPGQTASFSYTAPDGATRYFALQAFDSAGNGSAPVGDAGVTVTPIQFVTTGGATQAANTTTAAAVLGANTTTENTAPAVATTAPAGQVEATGNNTTATTPKKTTNGKVLGSEITKPNASHAGWWYGLGGLVVLLALAYYFLVHRSKRAVR